MLKEIIKNPYKILEIVISIYIIGIINMYLIGNNGFNIYIFEVFKINDNNIKILLFINLLFFILFNSNIKINNEISYKTIEFIYIISFGLLGLNLIILSNDLIFLFIAIELYSISVYLLILTQISKNSSRMSIIYLIISSLSSYTLLLGISFIYKYTGTLNLEILKEIYNTLFTQMEINNNYIFFGLLLILFGILIKLGTVPFNFWVLRLYTILENRILLYQLIIPKLVFLFLIHNIFINISNNIFYKYYFIFLIVSILSVLIGSIGGLFNTYFKSILTYSSILNMGFILIGIANELFKNQLNNHELVYITYLEYIFIYSFNTFSIFYCLLLINPNIINIQILNKYYFKSNINMNYPMLLIFLFISIFSFIGIPPLAGFYAKLNIFINILYSYNPFWIYSIIFLFISTLISACFYLKFILYFFFPYKNNNSNNTISSSGLISDIPFSYSYFFSFFSLFLIFYPFLSNYFYPFFFFTLI